jgi:glycosyltransferase involved in cell wall biosynthesis
LARNDGGSSDVIPEIGAADYPGSSPTSSQKPKAYRSRVIFQNSDDMQELIEANVVDKAVCRLVRGSGVDTEKFRPADLSSSRNSRSEYPGSIATDDTPAADEVRVFFASRLIAEKGINELIMAMEKVVARRPGVVLWVAGEPYAQNPTSLTPQDMKRLKALPWVQTFGHVDDVERLLAQVDIVALPSYREGTPKILLEAAACGLPIVATDIAGCRGVVEEGVNGYLVPVRDTATLAGRLEQLCADADLRRAMGAQGRQIILDGFSSEIVVRETLAVYGEVLGQSLV